MAQAHRARLLLVARLPVALRLPLNLPPLPPRRLPRPRHPRLRHPQAVVELLQNMASVEVRGGQEQQHVFLLTSALIPVPTILNACQREDSVESHL